MFRYEPAARRELDAAMDFYDQQRIGLGDEFLDEVERAIALLTENAKLGRGLPENCFSGFPSAWCMRWKIQASESSRSPTRNDALIIGADVSRSPSQGT